MDPVPNPAEAPDSGQEPARAGLQEEISPYIPVARIPRSTYRLQFSGRFTFRDAEALVAYLDDLGIGSCYASPLLRTPPGSSNGYDICDHSQFDPRLGTDQDFEAFSRSLRDRHMGLVVDIVPNHMGIGDPCNAWWMDVLENGPSSTYADYFDITWDPVKPELENKVLLPILEDQYGNVLESGKLRLAYEDGSLLLNYHQRVLPLAPRTYSLVLTSALDWLVSQLGIDDPAASDNPALLELQSILTALGYLPPRTEQDPSRIAERNRERQVIKRRIAGLYETSPDFRRALDETIAAFNGTPGQPRSFDRLDALVEAQAYRPAFWRVAAEEINYRRFFDINDMAAIRVELPEVFAAAHDLYLRLLAAGRITGARVDHPDGLWNPAEYFHKLQCEYVVRAVQEQQPELDRQELEHVIERRLDEILAARAVPGSPSPPLPLYVVAEKILSETEPLPRGWAVYGTTGYDFMNAVNGIYVDGDNEKAFNKIYSHFVGHSVSYPEVVYAAKRGIMRGSLSSEINSLAHQLERLAEKNRHYRDFTLDSITIALREVIAGLGIYRTYVDVERRAVSRRDETYLTAAVDKARRRNPAIPGSIFDFVRDTLLLRNFDDFPEPDRPAVAHFIMRFQQMTSPVMAKGVEDTAFYIYDRLVSLNEVGGNPAQFGLPLAAFHRHNSEIRRDWPHTLLATSTHDTKRSEDVRARINVLSEMPDEWRKNLARWRRINQAKKMMVDGEPAPDHDDEYLLYQTLLGAFPVGTSRDEFADFRERIASYMQKASKEAKVHTSWVSPNAGYDEAIRNFVFRLLTDRARDPFRLSIEAFARRVAYFGRLNSLSQTLLKIASPGVPDFYRGTELFDYSLVDPDNRRPVDYDLRKRLLAEIRERTGAAGENLGTLARELSEDQTGRSKLYVIEQGLNWRRGHGALFAEGSYQPLEVRGEKERFACAFVRASGEEIALAVVPRLVVGLLQGEERPPLGPEIWKDTRLVLPMDLADSRFRDLYSGRTLSVSREDGVSGIPLGQVLCDFPVALLERA